MFEKLLVALDNSDHATKTLEVASELGTKLGSEMRVLHVLELGFAGRAGQVELEDRKEAEEIVAKAVAALQARGLTATGAMYAAQTNRVAHEIAAEAANSGATAIVTGSRGRSGLETALIGSTTNKLLHLVEMPVVVAR